MVRDTADRLGYRASRAAASLRTGRTKIVGMVIAGSQDPLWSSQWVQVTARILVDAAEELNRLDYSLLVIPAKVADQIRSDDVDAIIFSDSLPDDPTLNNAFREGIPILTNDRLDDDRVSVHVDSGYQEMTEFAFDLFRQRGRSRPALLTEPDTFASDFTAERVWRGLCAKTNMTPLVERVSYDRHDLEQAVNSLLAQGADAIYSFAGEGDTVAEIVEKTGKSLDTDIMLVSSEMEISLPLAHQQVSTLVYHAEKGALHATAALLQVLEGTLPTPHKVKLGWEFVEAG